MGIVHEQHTCVHVCGWKYIYVHTKCGKERRRGKEGKWEGGGVRAVMRGQKPCCSAHTQQLGVDHTMLQDGDQEAIHSHHTLQEEVGLIDGTGRVHGNNETTQQP